MFAKTILVAFLSLSLAVSAVPAPAQNNQETCSAIIKTVTVTALPAAATDKGHVAVANPGASSSSIVSSAKTTAKSTSSAAGSKSTAKSSSSAASVKSTAKTSSAVSTKSTAKSSSVAGSKSTSVAGSKSTSVAGSKSTSVAGSKSSSVASSAATVIKGTSISSSAVATATNNAASAGGAGSCKGIDLQKCTTLDPSVIAKGFENDGQDVPAAGQVASLTSSNNFINFCATVPNLPITNGQQIKTGSCNPAPMGIIAATTNMPSSKFQFPPNFGTIKANTAFTIKMAISNLETGHFVNAQENYFSAPQQVNSAGNVQGHSHVVIEALSSLSQTNPTDPTRFAFFKGLNSAAQGGVLTADVTAGLPAGTYRLASINTAANHQPVLVAIAQHGSVDDMIYFTVTNDGNPAGAAAAAPATPSVGGFKGGKPKN